MNRPNKDWRTAISKKRNDPHNRNTDEIAAQDWVAMKAKPPVCEFWKRRLKVSHSA